MSMVGSSFPSSKRRAVTPTVNAAGSVPGDGGKGKPAAKQDKVLEELVASAIIRHGYPLSFFGMHKKLHTFLNPNVPDISSEVSKANCLEIYEREKVKLKHALSTVPGRFCLTVDVWTDVQTIEYLCLTVNYVDSNWKLQSKFLNLVPWEGSLLQIIYDLLLEWGIEKRIFTVTVDSGKCDDGLAGMLKDRLNQLDGDYFHVRCGARFMDKMVRECFKLIRKPIRKIREGIQYVVGHEKKRLKFKEAAEKLVGEGALEPLWSDCVYLWNSTYLMLERVIKYRSAFEHVMIDDEYTGWHLTEEEWSRVEKICELLNPLNNIANLFIGTEHPTANLYYIDVWMIDGLLKEGLEDKDPEISNLAKKMKSEYDEYWESYCTVLAFAIVFDPRYKFDFVKFSFERMYGAGAEEKYVHIYNQLDTLFKVYREQRFASENSGSGKLEEFFKWSKENEVNSSKSKLDGYLDEPRMNRKEELDVVSWWKENERRFPEELTLMARDILSIPITSFSKDSVFGMGYRVRDRLQDYSWTDNSVEALIAARNWLYGYEVNQEYPGGLMGCAERFWTSNGDEDSDSEADD
ncbi:zinc finger BED domain-containing protein DAYSLEEPER-like [Silene latifolia]|uniref:zinc finger BED domain-containing protein DAYSLEEPER-like n=1 Tax=Silene latifolia TaxID=37657 RepID=UPI003D784427